MSVNTVFWLVDLSPVTLGEQYENCCYKFFEMQIPDGFTQ